MCYLVGMTERIYGFEGEYRFLSNFYVLGGGGLTTEHLFQAAKAVETEDQAWIMKAPTPGDAKLRGRKVKLRQDWDTYRIEAMEKVLEYKFADPELREKLLATGDAELVEANTWHDTYWGVDKWTGNGYNMLGLLLMKLRERLKEEQDV